MTIRISLWSVNWLLFVSRRKPPLPKISLQGLGSPSTITVSIKDEWSSLWCKQLLKVQVGKLKSTCKLGIKYLHQKSSNKPVKYHAYHLDTWKVQSSGNFDSSVPRSEIEFEDRNKTFETTIVFLPELCGSMALFTSPYQMYATLCEQFLTTWSEQSPRRIGFGTNRAGPAR